MFKVIWSDLGVAGDQFEERIRLEIKPCASGVA
jgi:hypothetical protein